MSTTRCRNSITNNGGTGTGFLVQMGYTIFGIVMIIVCVGLINLKQISKVLQIFATSNIAEIKHVFEFASKFIQITKFLYLKIILYMYYRLYNIYRYI